MTQTLFVHHLGRLVGTLDRTQQGTMKFQYSDVWINSAESFPISLSLPIDREEYANAGHTYFSNLLPEADIRRLLCQELGISVDHDFELLAAIGGECAGALTITKSREYPKKSPGNEYLPLTLPALQKLMLRPVLPAVDGKNGIRLSLAGAQDKLPVLINDRKLFLPVGESPSTHILKFPSARFKHLPANEVFVTMIAREMGLPTVDAEYLGLGTQGVCVVKRYDRVCLENDVLDRIHQEDFCQALGESPHMKYEKEGGPSFQSCFDLIRRASSEPLADTLNVLRWLSFNTLVFNADGHAKNLSFVFEQNSTRLAPFYDLVCTRAYDRLATDLTMSVGGEFEPTQIRRSHWLKLANDLQLGESFVIQAVREMVETFPAAVTVASDRFREKYGEKPILQMILPRIRRQAKRVGQMLQE